MYVVVVLLHVYLVKRPSLVASDVLSVVSLVGGRLRSAEVVKLTLSISAYNTVRVGKRVC